MKLITLNFGTWSSCSNKSGRLRKNYKRVYIKGHKWTPFVTVKFEILPKNK
jgi:hypothetical protein